MPDDVTLNNSVPLAAINIKGRNTFPVEEIVLPDECGDTLWDDVLAQKEEPLAANNNYTSRVLSNKINAAKE